MVKIKGHDFRQITVRDSYNRRALQYKNKIINCLKFFGLTEDDVEISMEPNTMRKAPASASWYQWDEHLFYSYNRSGKFVENLAMVAQVIEHFVIELSNDKITPEEFLELFVEDEDVEAKRKDARKLLGVHEDSTDFDEIHMNYKQLSKEHHPDMPNGDLDKFKKINIAHKVLKRELC